MQYACISGWAHVFAYLYTLLCMSVFVSVSVCLSVCTYISLYLRLLMLNIYALRFQWKDTQNTSKNETKIKEIIVFILSYL